MKIEIDETKHPEVAAKIAELMESTKPNLWMPKVYSPNFVTGSAGILYQHNNSNPTFLANGTEFRTLELALEDKDSIYINRMFRQARDEVDPDYKRGAIWFEIYFSYGELRVSHRYSTTRNHNSVPFRNEDIAKRVIEMTSHLVIPVFKRLNGEDND